MTLPPFEGSDAGQPHLSDQVRRADNMSWEHAGKVLPAELVQRAGVEGRHLIVSSSRKPLFPQYCLFPESGGIKEYKIFLNELHEKESSAIATVCRTLLLEGQVIDACHIVFISGLKPIVPTPRVSASKITQIAPLMGTAQLEITEPTSDSLHLYSAEKTVPFTTGEVLYVFETAETVEAKKYTQFHISNITPPTIDYGELMLLVVPR